MSVVLAQLRAHARLVIGALLGVAVGAMVPGPGLQRFVIGWDAFAILYLAWTFWAMRGADAAVRRARAQATDDGAVVMLLAAVGSALASVAATLVQLASHRAATGDGMDQGYLALSVLTVATSWTLVHAVFAIHYAHVYELERLDDPEARGLVFPGEPAPEYLDFFYFSFVIGVAAQTADVSIASRTIRRLAMMQGVIAFWYNATILALALNAAAAAF